MPEVSRPSLVRVAVLPLVALAIAGAAFFAGKSDWTHRSSMPTRSVGTPTLKHTTQGSDVRWHSDAVDVVVDKSFSDLAGPKVFGAAVDAWRATGATLPSVSTKPGKDRQIGYRKGDNENVIVYAPEGWAKANGALAVTVLTYEDDSGHILDADVLLNGGGRYFAVFEHDQSSGDAISIDGTGTSPSGATPVQSTTARFDVQSVVTHELGHFFGLGEDQDDAKATMYVSTRHGEIHKRVVSKNEGSVISALYTEAAPAPDDGLQPRGCGGAQMARTGASSSTWIGFVVAALGLGLYTAARRARAEEQGARVTGALRRSAAARRMGRVGGWLTVIGMVASLTPPSVEAASDDVAVRGDAEVQIVGAEPRWVDGLVETELTYRVTACHMATCPEGDQRVVALGGKLDGITQIVGPFAMPELGARVSIGLRDGRGLLKTLRTTFQP